MSTSCEVGLKWVAENTTDIMSRLVQLIAWAVRQQANAWTNVDPDVFHMMSLGYYELNKSDVTVEYDVERWMSDACEAKHWF